MMNTCFIKQIFISLCWFLLSGIGGKNIRTCLSNWVTFIDNKSWRVCKVKRSKTNLHYFINKVNNDTCALNVTQEIISEKPIKHCSTRIMEHVKAIESQPALVLDLLGRLSTSETPLLDTLSQVVPDCKDSWKTLLEDSNNKICRVTPEGNHYYITHDITGEMCSVKISESHLQDMDMDVPLCVTPPAASLPCSSNPCRNGGSCLSHFLRSHSYSCLCPTGYDPKVDCKKACPPGSWGDSCENKCGACAESTKTIQYKVFAKQRIALCRPTTGCRRCAVGVTPKRFCNKVNCRKAVCRNNGRCVDVGCTCVPGYTGTLCETDLGTGSLQKCDLGKYNRREICNRHGNCVKVKNRDGFYKQVCRCDEGWAGQSCTDRCAEQTETCLHGICERKHTCKCDTGYFNSNCNASCPEGTWGEDCKERCGSCKFFPCRNTDGKCPQSRCRIGYTPPLCIKLSPKQAEEEQLFTSQMELETDDEEEYYDALESDSVDEAATKIAIQTYIEKQLRRILTADVPAKVADVTLSPVPATPLPGNNEGPTFFTRRNAAIKARQRGTSNAGILAEFTVVLPPNTVTNSAEFTDNLAKNIKGNVNELEAGGFTLKTESVQVTELRTPELDASGPGVNKTGVYAALGTCTVLMAVIGTVIMFKHQPNTRKKKKKMGTRKSKHRRSTRAIRSRNATGRKSSTRSSTV